VQFGQRLAGVTTTARPKQQVAWPATAVG
jgi:hypothetical protein